MALDLPISRFTANLQDKIANLRDAGSSHRVAFRLQSATGIDGALASQRSVAFSGVWSAAALRNEAEIFGGDDFGDGETVVHFGELDIGGGNASHLIRLPC